MAKEAAKRAHTIQFAEAEALSAELLAQSREQACADVERLIGELVAEKPRRYGPSHGDRARAYQRTQERVERVLFLAASRLRHEGEQRARARLENVVVLAAAQAGAHAELAAGEWAMVEYAQMMGVARWLLRCFDASEAAVDDVEARVRVRRERAGREAHEASRRLGDLFCRASPVSAEDLEAAAELAAVVLTHYERVLLPASHPAAAELCDTLLRFGMRAIELSREALLAHEQAAATRLVERAAWFFERGRVADRRALICTQHTVAVIERLSTALPLLRRAGAELSQLAAAPAGADAVAHAALVDMVAEVLEFERVLREPRAVDESLAAARELLEECVGEIERAEAEMRALEQGGEGAAALRATMQPPLVAYCLTLCRVIRGAVGAGSVARGNRLCELLDWAAAQLLPGPLAEQTQAEALDAAVTLGDAEVRIALDEVHTRLGKEPLDSARIHRLLERALATRSRAHVEELQRCLVLLVEAALRAADDLVHDQQLGPTERLMRDARWAVDEISDARERERERLLLTALEQVIASEYERHREAAVARIADARAIVAGRPPRPLDVARRLLREATQLELHPEARHVVSQRCSDTLGEVRRLAAIDTSFALQAGALACGSCLSGGDDDQMERAVLKKLVAERAQQQALYQARVDAAAPLLYETVSRHMLVLAARNRVPPTVTPGPEHRFLVHLTAAPADALVRVEEEPEPGDFARVEFRVEAVEAPGHTTTGLLVSVLAVAKRPWHPGTYGPANVRIVVDGRPLRPQAFHTLVVPDPVLRPFSRVQVIDGASRQQLDAEIEFRSAVTGSVRSTFRPHQLISLEPGAYHYVVRAASASRDYWAASGTVVQVGDCYREGVATLCASPALSRSNAVRFMLVAPAGASLEVVTSSGAACEAPCHVRALGVAMTRGALLGSPSGAGVHTCVLEPTSEEIEYAVSVRWSGGEPPPAALAEDEHASAFCAAREQDWRLEVSDWTGRVAVLPVADPRMSAGASGPPDARDAWWHACRVHVRRVSAAQPLPGDWKATVSLTDELGGERLRFPTAALIEAIRAGRTRTFLANLMEGDKRMLAALNERGETLLHVAAQRLNTDICRWLIDEGLDPLAVDEAGAAPLHYLCRAPNARFLVERLLGVSPEAVALCDAEGRSPLHLAAQHRNLPVGLALLEAGADPAVLDRRHRLPLHLCMGGDTALALAIVAAMDDISAVDDMGFTFLHLAAEALNSRLASALIERGLSPAARARNGFTPLHIAVQASAIDVVEAVLPRGHIDSIVALGTPPSVFELAATAEMKELLVARNLGAPSSSVAREEGPPEGGEEV